MKMFRVNYNVDGEEHVVRIKKDSALSAIEEVQKQSMVNYPCKRWSLIEVEEVNDN